jgi:hypothetical protein
MQHRGLTEEETEEMAEALYAADEGNWQKADVLFDAFTKKCRAAAVVDELQGYIIDHQERFDPSRIAQSSLQILLHSSHAECIKTALEILELIRVNDGSFKTIIRNLSLYDEFTLFALWVMRNWENGNREIFRTAQNVRGWGRIHAVRLLAPDSDEIRFWLLTEGFRNDVMSAYSALTCWEKSNAENILQGDPSGDEFRGITALIYHLLDEGPVQGISALADPEEVLLRFLGLSGSYPLSDDTVETVRAVRDWADSEEHPYPAVSAKCREILTAESEQ